MIEMVTEMAAWSDPMDRSQGARPSRTHGTKVAAAFVVTGAIGLLAVAAGFRMKGWI